MFKPSGRVSQQSQPSEQEIGLSVEQPETKHLCTSTVSQYVASLPTQSAELVQASPSPTAADLQVAGVTVVSQAKPCGQSASFSHVVVQ